jgi:uncharacterized protein YndB with AHSA1/START domain
MKENKLSIEINRPVSKVFEFTTNPKKTPLWIDSIVNEERNESPVKLGTEYKNVNKKGERSTYKVVRLESNKIFELKQENSQYSVRYTYERISDTKTKLTYHEWVENGELEGPFTQDTMEKLKKIMENKE